MRPIPRGRSCAFLWVVRPRSTSSSGCRSSGTNHRHSARSLGALLHALPGDESTQGEDLGRVRSALGRALTSDPPRESLGMERLTAQGHHPPFDTVGGMTAPRPGRTSVRRLRQVSRKSQSLPSQAMRTSAFSGSPRQRGAPACGFLLPPGAKPVQSSRLIQRLGVDGTDSRSWAVRRVIDSSGVGK